LSIVAQLVPRGITLDELIALSDEIAALARAGVPLDKGLLAFGGDVSGRLGKLATELGQRLEKGESLAAVIAASASFSPAYKAVVAAGLRAGRLPAALEDVARAARRTAQLRTSVGVALLYPAIVLFVAYSLLIFSIRKLLPVMIGACEAWDIRLPFLYETAAWLQATLPFWQNALPLLAVGIVVWGWLRSRQVVYGATVNPLLRFGMLGSLVRLRTAGQLAALNELLAMLLEHGVPLPVALPLAAATAGSAALERGGRELAERLQRGELGGKAPAGFPPLLAWTLASTAAQANLPAILRRSAQSYRDEAARRAQWLAIYYPLLVTVVFGGSVVMLFAVLTLGPWLLVLYRMAEAAGAL
jgi:general secretion pathway protein F